MTIKQLDCLLGNSVLSRYGFGYDAPTLELDAHKFTDSCMNASKYHIGTVCQVSHQALAETYGHSSQLLRWLFV